VRRLLSPRRCGRGGWRAGCGGGLGDELPSLSAPDARRRRSHGRRARRRRLRGPSPTALETLRQAVHARSIQSAQAASEDPAESPIRAAWIIS